MQAVLRLPVRLVGENSNLALGALHILGADDPDRGLRSRSVFWVSFQKGISVRHRRSYTLANYRELLTDPFVLQVIKNTLIFACVEHSSCACYRPADCVASGADDASREDAGLHLS